MQRVLSLFIIFILSFSPIMNASASLLTCNNIMPDSVSENASHLVEADMTANMTSTHDCCDNPSLICDHASACDCDNTQVSYSVVPALKIQQPLDFLNIEQHYISPLILSSALDALYRPPINIFI